MSLGGGNSPTLDEAVNAAVDTGILFAVAAGNDNRLVVLRFSPLQADGYHRDACTSSPASAAGPITVGATAINDKRAYFSNHGK